MRQWRLIISGVNTGTTNMATDEAILHAVSEQHQKPTLRLYGWQPHCLSLGYGQRIADIDLVRLDSHDWHIVRRPTGGKAILHGDELTYSVALPGDHELAQGDVVTSYRRISEALLHALTQLGLAPHSEKQAKGNRGLGPICFEVPSHYEITVNGKKLLGSAQVRRQAGVLQHGTLPLHGDISRICEVLTYPDEATRIHAKQTVHDRATTLEAVLQRTVAWQTAADALIIGFERTFGIEFEEAALSPLEEQYRQDLYRQRYGNADWLHKR